jgi:hypothetical protein
MGLLSRATDPSLQLRTLQRWGLLAVLLPTISAACESHPPPGGGGAAGTGAEAGAGLDGGEGGKPAGGAGEAGEPPATSGGNGASSGTAGAGASPGTGGKNQSGGSSGFDGEGGKEEVAGQGGSSAGSQSVDPCAQVTCSGHGTCRPFEDGVRCTCDPGYALDPNDPSACIDVDECQVDNGGCDPLTQCTNVAGSRTCSACPAWTEGDGETGCAIACTKVTPDGDDDAALASGGTLPFANVQTAIDFVSANPELPPVICVAVGTLCQGRAVYPGPSGSDLRMRNGVSVYGRFASADWTRCNGLETVLEPLTPVGVLFGPDIVSPTVLDGFAISNLDSPVTATITVDGAVGVTLVGVLKGNELKPSAVESYGVDVMNGAEVTLRDCQIRSANGVGASIALRSVGSRVTAFDAVDESVFMAQGEGRVTAVWLEDSPGSSIVGSTIYALGTTDDPNDTRNIVTGAYVTGSSDGIELRDGPIIATNGLLESSGVWLQDCTSGEVLIEGNTIQADTPDAVFTDYERAPTDGIRVLDGCRALISGNEIVSRGGIDIEVNGVRCDIFLGAESNCTITGNPTIATDRTNVRPGETPPTNTGIRCGDLCCDLIADNHVVGLATVSDYYAARTRAVGIHAGRGVMIERNVVEAGCAKVAIGARVLRGTVRNNLIFGASCPRAPIEPGETFGGMSTGLFFSLGDVNSNLIDGAGFPGYCGMSRAVESPYGTFRNNIFRAGVCGSDGVEPAGNHAFVLTPTVTPQLTLENNDFDPSDQPTTLFTDLGPIVLRSVDEVNSYVAVTSSGNFSRDPKFLTPGSSLSRSQGDFHLASDSPCIDAGTPTDAPSTDFESLPRSATPDVGPYEWGDFPLCNGVSCSGAGHCSEVAASPVCTCDPGFKNPAGNSESCVDVDECSVENGGCTLATCTNVPGSRICGPCPGGYAPDTTGDCVPENYCLPRPCQHGGSCIETESGYECVCPPGITGPDCELVFTSLAAGPLHACGVRNDGTLACWGSNPSGGASPPEGNFLQVTAGYEHSCALRANSTITCWGRNQVGQAAPPSGTFQAIATKLHFSCGLRTTGAVSCWGTGATNAPSGTFTKVAVGSFHACALTTGGNSVCWGDNTSGQLDAPSQVFSDLDAGSSQTCGLLPDGTLQCWGNDLFGQSSPPSGVFGTPSLNEILGCAIRNDQTIACWGNNISGSGVPPAGTFKQIAVGNAYGCGIRTDDSVDCWGDNQWGQGRPPSGP